jgi:hypothetical protein
MTSFPRMDTPDELFRRRYPSPAVHILQLNCIGHFDGHDVHANATLTTFICVYGSQPGDFAFVSRERVMSQLAIDGLGEWSSSRAAAKAFKAQRARHRELVHALRDIVSTLDDDSSMHCAIIERCDEAADLLEDLLRDASEVADGE